MKVQREPYTSRLHKSAWLVVPYAFRRIVGGRRIVQIYRGGDYHAVPLNDLSRAEVEGLIANARSGSQDPARAPSTTPI